MDWCKIPCLGEMGLYVWFGHVGLSISDHIWGLFVFTYVYIFDLYIYLISNPRLFNYCKILLLTSYLLFLWLPMPCNCIPISIWQKAQIESFLRYLPAFIVISIHITLFTDIRMCILKCKIERVPTILSCSHWHFTGSMHVLTMLTAFSRQQFSVFRVLILRDVWILLHMPFHRIVALIILQNSSWNWTRVWLPAPMQAKPTRQVLVGRKEVYANAGHLRK